MDTNALKKFAQEARRDLLEQVKARLEQVLTTDSVALREKLGIVNELRQQLKGKSKETLVEEVAYTWFNRLCALRYMDVNQITKVGVVSPIPGFTQPEILQEAKQGIFNPDWRLDKSRVQGLLNGLIPSSNPEQEVYRLLLVAVCNSYAEEMDFLFPKIEDYTELLMPEDLLSTQSVLHAVREALTEDVCQDVEVIGWLYQFYISEKKDEVMGSKGKVAKEDIPAVTQLFTPHWIVRYMVENSLGRLWLLNHPESKIREQMEYYIPESPTLSPRERAKGEGERAKGEGERAKGEGERAKGEGKKPLSPAMLQRCRDLRKNATDAEQLLWACLRDRNLAGYKFRRQHPVDHYILDFYCHEARLCIELDGGGHTEPDQQNYDAERTAFLESQGIEVLRYWNHEVMEDLELVLETILEKCQTKNPHLNPLPLGEEAFSPLPPGEGQGEGSFLKVDSPEDLKILDPACGSGHILTYSFDLLYAIYEEMGYDPISIPKLILEKNLYGIEISKRAAMLSSFALMMKAVDKDKRFFKRGVQPNILEMEDVAFEPQEVKAYMAKVGEDLWTQELWEGLQQFENAEMFGSLIQPSLKDIPELRERLAAKGVFEELFLAETNRKVVKVLEMSEYLSPRYHAVVANPPYFSKGMDSDYKQFAKDYYPDSKRDTLSMFVERNLELAQLDGYVGMVTLMSWMFLSSFETFRKNLIAQDTILTMAHLGARAFDTIGGEVVSTTMFVLKNSHLEDFNGAYFRLVEGDSEIEKIKALKEAIANPDCGWFFRASAPDFQKIPGAPIAYWLSKKARKAFEVGKCLSSISKPKIGMRTGNNQLFLRLWFEISKNKFTTQCLSSEDALRSKKKWFPYNKGGDYRKWFGNHSYVINWFNDGQEIKENTLKNYPQLSWDNLGWKISNEKDFFKQSITWSFVSSSYFGVRYSEPGAIFDVGGSSIFPKESDIFWLTGFLCSKLSTIFMKAMNPTLNFQVRDVAALPIIKINDKKRATRIAQLLIEISKYDWNSLETSWDFSTHPLIKTNSLPLKIKLSTCYEKLRADWKILITKTKQLEEENNTIYISTYELDNETSPDVQLDDITLTCNPYHRYSGKYSEDELENRLQEETMKEFISYAVGCMFGRYSLDKPGLILANQGETVKDYYKALALLEDSATFPPTKTNVIPILEGEWFADDILAQFKRFLRVTFGEENFAENLRFIEEALGKDLQKYFLRDFYQDHVQMYKKCPIYWLFSSPNGSFNALIYMHRYTPETVSVVLNQYLREYRDKISSHRANLERIITNGTASAREKNLALKEIEDISKILAELKEYEDDILFPLASKQIEIDLDDGVKVNYAKFGEAFKKI
jgi:very-short-patch-repair endonuclease